jgi:transposase
MAPDVAGLSRPELEQLALDQWAMLTKMEGELAEIKRLLFGQKRERFRPEKMPTMARALRHRQGFDDEATALARRLRAKEKRAERALKKKSLPVEDVLHPIDQCPHCQSEDLEDLRTAEISDEFEFVPARVVRRRHVRPKKKCKRCQQIFTAPAPQRVGDGVTWGPAMHAHTVVAKCADSIPFYRLARRFTRDGIPIERSTLDRLFHRSAELLAPIAKRILELVAASKRVNADETPVFVQAPEKCRRGYMWTFLAEKNIAFAFSPTRSGETPKRILAGTDGYLQVDAFTGYNAVFVPDGRERVGCLAHARRRFFNALASAQQNATEALDWILSLYEVEYEAAARNILGTPAHLALRKAMTTERMDGFAAWMAEREPHYPPQSPMGAALRYGTKTLESLRPILSDPKLRLDNNLAEGALRLVALGRKNFLFVGDDESGQNLAVLQTVVATCIAHGVNPEAYIADILLRLADTPTSKIDGLLPENWRPPPQAITPPAPS